MISKKKSLFLLQVFEDETEAARYCDLLQGGGKGCEGVFEIEASSVRDSDISLPNSSNILLSALWLSYYPNFKYVCAYLFRCLISARRWGLLLSCSEEGGHLLCLKASSLTSKLVNDHLKTRTSWCEHHIFTGKHGTIVTCNASGNYTEKGNGIHTYSLGVI